MGWRGRYAACGKNQMRDDERKKKKDRRRLGINTFKARKSRIDAKGFRNMAYAEPCHSLQRLSDLGILASRRDGNNIHYRLVISACGRYWTRACASWKKLMTEAGGNTERNVNRVRFAANAGSGV